MLPIDEADCLGYAANSLCVNGTVLMPAGLSTGLRGNLLKRGFNLEELELGELFGKGGGGPRCLVNELRGFVLTEDAPDYVSRRDRLHALAEQLSRVSRESDSSGGNSAAGASTYGTWPQRSIATNSAPSASAVARAVAMAMGSSSPCATIAGTPSAASDGRRS